MRRNIFIIAFLLLVTGFCPNPLFAQHFDRVQEGVITSEQRFSVGSSWVDINNDGYPDLYVANNRNENNALYINEGYGTFRLDDSRIITNDAKRGSSPVWADFDNDGDMDLFVSNASGQNNDLYVNQGNGEFIDNDEVIIAQDGESSIAAAWGDYNNDGHVDLFVGNGFHDIRNALYRNNGDGTFTKITSEPIGQKRADTRSAAWGDMDNDGDLDLFVGNMYGQQDYLYENQGNGTFKEVQEGPVVESQRTSTSASWIDYDNDGDLDLFVGGGNQKENVLFKNDGDGNFTRVTEGILVEDLRSSSGHCWADFNNDGWLDVYVAGGHGSTAETNNLYMGEGDGQFRKVTEGSAVSHLKTSRGVTCSDVDKDGYMDIFVANGHYASNSLYMNQLTGNNWLAATLKGSESNRAAIGSKVRVLSSINERNMWQMRTVASLTGHRSQNSMTVHFGMSDAQQVDSLIVEWPSGHTTRRTNVETNQHITITEDSSAGFTLAVGKVAGIAGDTVAIPVKVRHNTDHQLNAFEIDLSGVSNTFADAWLDTTHTLLSDKQWELAFNSGTDPVGIAGAGGVAVAQEGTLFNLKVVVPDTAHTFKPVTIEKALFNTDLHPGKLQHGGVGFPSTGDVDFNGLVQSYDGSVILQHLIDSYSLSESQQRIADVTRNGEVTALDASIILRYVVGLEDALPVDTSDVAEAQVDEIAMGTHRYAPGDIVEIPVKIGGGSGIQSFEGVFSFDSPYLEFRGIKLGSQWDSFSLKEGQQEDKIRFAGMSESTVNVSSNTFVTAVFKVKTDIETSINPEVVLNKIRFNEGTTRKNIAKSVLVSIDDAPGESKPDKVELLPNYPNPFNPSTNIRFKLPNASRVQLSVYNTLGQEVSTLIDGRLKPGAHSVTFDASGLPSGVYIYRLEADGFSQSRKMMLVK